MEVYNGSDEGYDALVFRLVQIEQRLAKLESPSAKFIPLDESFEEPVSGAEKIQELQHRIEELESLERERQGAQRRRAEEVERRQAQRSVQMAQVAAAAAENNAGSDGQRTIENKCLAKHAKECR